MGGARPQPPRLSPWSSVCRRWTASRDRLIWATGASGMGDAALPDSSGRRVGRAPWASAVLRQSINRRASPRGHRLIAEAVASPGRRRLRALASGHGRDTSAPSRRTASRALSLHALGSRARGPARAGGGQRGPHEMSRGLSLQETSESSRSTRARQATKSATELAPGPVCRGPGGAPAGERAARGTGPSRGRRGGRPAPGFPGASSPYTGAPATTCDRPNGSAGRVRLADARLYAQVRVCRTSTASSPSVGRGLGREESAGSCTSCRSGDDQPPGESSSRDRSRR